MDTRTYVAHLLSDVAYCERCIVRAVLDFYDVPVTVLAAAGFNQHSPAERALPYLFRGNIATLRGRLAPAMQPRLLRGAKAPESCRHLTGGRA